MSRRSEFVATLRMLLQAKAELWDARSVIEELELASSVPEEAVPAAVHVAAFAFFEWRVRGCAKPAWFAEWEEAARESQAARPASLAPAEVPLDEPRAGAIGGGSRRAQILAFIKAHILAEQCAPTVREICAHCGMNSSNGVQEHLVILEKEGKIALSKNAGGPVRSRGLRVLGARLQWADEVGENAPRRDDSSST